MIKGLGFTEPALAWFRAASKPKKFAAILGVMAVLGLVLSMAAKITFVPKDSASSFRIALAAPLSGPSAEIGKSMRQGAQFLVENLNKAGGIEGHTVVLDLHDDQGDPVEAARLAQTIAAAPGTVAVIGHWTNDAAEAAAAVYRQAGIPLLAPSGGWPELTAASATDGKDRWVFSPLYDAKAEARFLANYARNVMGHKLMSMVVEDSAYGRAMADQFVETFQRFGAPPQFRFTFVPGDAAGIKRVVDDYKAKRDEAGALFIAASEANAPPVIKAFKDASLRPAWFGLGRLGTNSFTQAFGPQGQNYTNGIYVSSPLLFDTANEAAQTFKGAYRQRFGTEPDWVAAFAHDSAKMLADTLAEHAIAGGSANSAARRLKLRDAIAARIKAEDGIKGVTGTTVFPDNGRAATPVLMGIYNGENLISALTQLQPIQPGAVSNYIEELRQGRVLYVNDRFMYKTNVVYVGLQVKEISGLDLEKEIAELDLAVWVRYRGDFKPQDVQFANAVDEIKMGEPADEGVVGDMSYRLYRFKGKFNMNFSGARRSYGSHIVGVSFRHKALNRNNLLYVIDVLGMPSGQALKERLIKDKVIPAGLGWSVDRAWVSQEVAAEDSLGDPKYVGHGAIAPDFSKIDLGIVIKKSNLSARDVIPTEWFIYIAIFGAIASIFAHAMDGKRLGRFWYMHSFGLRVVFWPLLLLAAGNLILDYAYQNMALAEVWLAVTAYDVLWWVIPARLITMAVSRFAWTPLEERSGRAIPNVVRMFVAFLIYAFAFLGIIGLVLDQPITSLLAGSGLLAMIIGLAIQANISNIFSGIVLNMERPFGVGDWVKIGSAEDARVTDITWRTTRLMTRSGMSIAIPNAKASESQIVNYSVEGRARLNITLHVDPSLPTEDVRKALYDAPLHVPGVMANPPPGVYFDGIVSADGGWLAQYSVQYWIADYSGKTAISGRVWDAVYSRLKAAGIALGSGLGARSGAAFAAMEGEGKELKLEDKPEWEFIENEFEDSIENMAIKAVD
jgi:potassium efflux system protein